MLGLGCGVDHTVGLSYFFVDLEMKMVMQCNLLETAKWLVYFLSGVRFIDRYILMAD